MARYQESYGDDEYEPYSQDSLYPYESNVFDYDLYLDRKIVFYPRYDHKTEEWVCDCSQFRSDRKCSHCYRFRGEEEIVVNPEYL